MGVYGEGTPEDAETGPAHCCSGAVDSVCSLVIVRWFGTRLIPPLAFLFFCTGPQGAEGEACRERLRGVIDIEAVWEASEGIAYGIIVCDRN